MGRPASPTSSNVDSTPKSKKPLLISINNNVYDVSNWIPYHPGGDVISKWEGRDATDVFTALHDQTTFKKLEAFKYKVQDHTTVIQPTSRTLRFEALRLKLQKMGLMTTNPWWYVYKSITTLSFLVFAMILVAYDYSLLGAVSLGIGFQQLGWLAHDYCHHQVFPSRKWNRIAGYFFGNIAQGYSQRWWSDRHNSHHAITNVLDSDPDIDNLPLFVWSVHDVARVPQAIKPMLRYQQYYFLFPFCPSLRLIWNLQSILFVKSLRSHPNVVYRKYANPEQITLILHWVWYFTLLYFASNKLLFFLISQGLPGFGIAIIVFFNHYACHHFKDTTEDFDFLELQLRTTRDMEPGLITDWICGGLNYQIEHHLFPTAPRHSLSAISKIIKKFCEEENLPYQSADFVTGVGYLLQQLGTVSDTLDKIKAHEQ